MRLRFFWLLVLIGGVVGVSGAESNESAGAADEAVADAAVGELIDPGAAAEAGEIEVAVPPVRLVFAPPDLPGRFVLGVFDAEGALVRRLVTDRDASVFDVGLNGFVTTWDGRDDVGARSPGGVYRARGFVVGEVVTVQGVAFHFNDWVTEDRPDPVRDVLAVELSPDGGQLTVLVRTVDRQHLERIDLDTGEVQSVFDAGAVAEFRSARQQVNRDVPGMAASEVVAAVDGTEATRWAIVSVQGEVAVVQFGGGGEVVRSLAVGEDGFVPMALAAARDAEVVALLEVRAGGGSRVRALRREVAGAGEAAVAATSADWVALFERTIVPSAGFGVVGGEVVAGGSGAARLPVKVTVTPEPNLLESAPAPVELVAGFDQRGSYVGTADGLELLRVSPSDSVERVAMVPGPDAGSVRFFEGDGLVVREFLIEKLNALAAFECGSFELATEE